jgi:hypothetical protein
MTQARKGGTRLRPGDVLAVIDDDQKWLLCYCGRDASLGDTVWVRSGAMHPNEPMDCATFTADGFYAFYPATAALRQRRVTREGFCAEGMRLLPPLRRIGSPFRRDGEPTTWRIATDANIGTSFTLRSRLTQSEARIPEGAIWNHAFLVERLRSGWHPSLEAEQGDED